MQRSTLLVFLSLAIWLIPDTAISQKTEEFITNGRSFKRKTKPKPPGDHEHICPEQEYRTISGECNNVKATGQYWGSSDISLYREMHEYYGSTDPFNSMGGENRKSPRKISNTLCSEDSAVPSERGLSSFVFTWGQFLDHDITLTPEDHIEYEPIRLPGDESLFTEDIPFFRSAVYQGTGTLNYRQQRNLITSWIDGSNVYGSDEDRADWLRSFNKGKLKLSKGGLLPYNTMDGEYESDIDPDAPSMAGDEGGTVKTFVAGDVRAVEQPGLTALHTLFARLHNKICDRLFSEGLRGDEKLYQEARKEVGAVIQNITFKEFLPALGINLSKDRGYDDRVQADVSNIFATAAYRLGHTMVTDKLLLIEDNCTPHNDESLSLLEGFFNPEVLKNYSIENILMGLSVQKQNAVDLKITDELRNFLFGDPSTGIVFGLDLASLNIQRGRDHGLPDYNSVRKKYTGTAATDFKDITKDQDIQDKLAEVYDSVDDIDLWVGLLAEDKKEGSSVGPTLHEVLKKQFEHLRDGDRFYFEHDKYLSRNEKDRIKKMTLSKVIKQNTGISEISSNVFFARECTSNKMKENIFTRSWEVIDEFNVFPNPVSDILYIERADNGISRKIEMYDSKGNKVLSGSIEGLDERLDLGFLPSGVYVLTIETSDVPVTKRIYKQ